MMDKVFVAAVAWIADTDLRDMYHEKAARMFKKLLVKKRQLVTTNLVIAEAHILIRRTGGHTDQ